MSDTTCVKCGAEDSFSKAGKADSSRNQRYQCNKCKYRTTNPWESEAITLFRDELPTGYDRYVVTAAQNATGLHRGFYRALKKYCEVNNALLVIIPFRYRNPTSMWTKNNEGDDWWNTDLTDHLYQGRLDLNAKLQICADVPITPTKVSPLSGFDTYTGDKSAIFGHPKLELKCIATPHSKLPKMIMTTGCVTKRNYTPSVAGMKGNFHHTYGATVAEIDGDVFHTRQINAMRDGSFMEIAGGVVRRYTGNTVKKLPGIEALVMGDTHVDFIDKKVEEATFGEQGMVKLLKPKKLVWHDLLDFFSRSHHCNAIGNIAKAKTGRDDVEGEVRRAVNFILDNTPKGTKTVLVPSNHDEHLGKWIDEADWKEEGINAQFYLDTAAEMVRTATVDPEYGIVFGNPFHYWVNEWVPNHKFTLLSRDTSDQAKEIELSMHGDLGPNGARGSIMNLSKIGVKSVIGHSHTPGIREGCYQTGTSSVLRRDWNRGPSSWMQTHCLVYPNGKRTLINMIDGSWRLNEVPNFTGGSA